jgi:G-patch domain
MASSTPTSGRSTPKLTSDDFRALVRGYRSATPTSDADAESQAAKPPGRLFDKKYRGQPVAFASSSQILSSREVSISQPKSRGFDDRGAHTQPPQDERPKSAPLQTTDAAGHPLITGTTNKEFSKYQYGLSILAKQGFDPEAHKGLGAKGNEGLLEPIQPIQKQDRMGLGAPTVVKKEVHKVSKRERLVSRAEREVARLEARIKKRTAEEEQKKRDEALRRAIMDPRVTAVPKFL